ncbi:MAG: Holliday junction resolvase RuvX [Verrucomicrobiota bacterium]
MSRYLALDHGDKRIGVAITDELLMLASPLDLIANDSFNKVTAEIKKLVTEYEISLIIIGIPRNMDGSYGPAAAKVHDFAARLKERIIVPIETIDERLTTVEASRRLHEAGKDSRKQKKKIDSASAQIILQSYLDTHQQDPFNL